MTSTTGIIRWYKAEKNYGFIRVENSTERDVFFHSTAVRGFQPQAGDRVSFQLARSEKGAIAHSVRKLDEADAIEAEALTSSATG
jgi:cold shock protein